MSLTREQLITLSNPTKSLSFFKAENRLYQSAFRNFRAKNLPESPLSLDIKHTQHIYGSHEFATFHCANKIPKSLLARIIKNEAIRAGATLVGKQFLQTSNGELSGGVVIAESHILMHIIQLPDNTYTMLIDAYTCGNKLNPSNIIRAIYARLKKYFSIELIEKIAFKRGIYAIKPNVSEKESALLYATTSMTVSNQDTPTIIPLDNIVLKKLGNALTADVIIDNFVTYEDLLLFLPNTNTGNIRARFNEETGTLRLTSADESATLTEYEAAIRAIQYQNTDPEINRITKQFSFIIHPKPKYISDETRSFIPGIAYRENQQLRFFPTVPAKPRENRTALGMHVVGEFYCAAPEITNNGKLISQAVLEAIANQGVNPNVFQHIINFNPQGVSFVWLGKISEDEKKFIQITTHTWPELKDNIMPVDIFVSPETGIDPVRFMYDLAQLVGAQKYKVYAFKRGVHEKGQLKPVLSEYIPERVRLT